MSEPITARTPASDAPLAPSNLGFSQTVSTLQVDWKLTDASVVSQKVYVEEVINERQTKAVENSPFLASGSARQYTVEGLKSGTNYRVRVQATNADGNESPKSNLLCAVTKDDKPDAPINLTEDKSNKD